LADEGGKTGRQKVDRANRFLPVEPKIGIVQAAEWRGCLQIGRRTIIVCENGKYF
jgi:hypothetical protein